MKSSCKSLFLVNGSPYICILHNSTNSAQGFPVVKRFPWFSESSKSFWKELIRENTTRNTGVSLKYDSKKYNSMHIKIDRYKDTQRERRKKKSLCTQLHLFAEEKEERRQLMHGKFTGKLSDRTSVIHEIFLYVNQSHPKSVPRSY